MSKAFLSGVIIFMLAATVASAASLFKASPATEDDYCFGYAVCE